MYRYIYDAIYPPKKHLPLDIRDQIVLFDISELKKSFKVERDQTIQEMIRNFEKKTLRKTETMESNNIPVHYGTRMEAITYFIIKRPRIKNRRRRRKHYVKFNY